MGVRTRMVSAPLAKTGDSDCRQNLSEYTLVARNEKAAGAVFDPTTSWGAWLATLARLET
jgi:hypothetical protein